MQGNGMGGGATPQGGREIREQSCGRKMIVVLVCVEGKEVA